MRLFPYARTRPDSGGPPSACALVRLRGISVFLVSVMLASLAVALPGHQLRAEASGYSSTILGDSPVVYYRLDEASGTTAADSSGHGYSATYASSGITYGVAGAISGDSDKAITSSFSGAAASRSDSALPTGAGARSVEAWEKTTGGGTYSLLSYGALSANGYASLNINGPTTISFDAWNYYVLTSTPYSVEDGAWHYLAATYDGSTATLYLDGVAMGSGSLSMNTSASQGLWLGDAQDGAGAFPGSLDEEAVYAAALTAAQISTHWRSGVGASSCPAAPGGRYPSSVMSDSPLRYFRLGEATGPVATDSASTTGCQPATYNTGAVHGPGGLVTDTSGSAGSPSPAATIALAPSTSLPSGASARTIEVWEKTTGTGTYSLASYGATTTNQYVSLNLNGANTISFDGWVNYVAANTTPSAEDGNWHQVAATYDGTTAVLYLDGSQVGTGSLSLSTSLSGQALWIGQAQDGGTAFPGSEEEVAIYPAALSAARINAHFSAWQLAGGPYTSAQAAGGGVNYCVPCHGDQIRHASATGFPIDTASGNFWHAFTDVSISGRSYPLEIDRTYNSSSAATNGPFGYGWQMNYGMSLAVNGSTATISQENGSQVTFTLSGSTWSPSAPRFIATLTHNGDGTWTFVRNARDTYALNSSGQLTSETDLNGYSTSFGYTSGNLTSITDPAGRSLSLAWTSGHVTGLTDANVSPSRTVQYQYNDGSGNLTDVIDVAGNHWQFTYDTSHRMTVMKDPRCYNTTGCPGIQNTFDSAGRVSNQKDQLNRQTSFDYSAIPGATKTTDPKSNVRVDYYSQGLRTATTSGYGSVVASTTRFTYDPSTLALASVVDGNGHVTSYTDDSSGNVLTATDPLNRTTTYTYNSLNEPLTIKDALTVTTTNTYDTKGNLTSTSRPLTGTSQVQVTSYNHTDASHPGDVTSMVDPDSKTWTYGYDGNGYRNSVSDPLGDKATSVFNADGWLTSSVSPKGNVSGCGCQSQFTTSYGHDAYGSLTTLTDPLGHVSTKHYDADQNLDWSQDADSNKTTFVYDQANQQTQIQRPDATTLTTDYNSDATVLDQKDGKNNALLTYAYDAQARVTSTSDALSNTTNYAYDGAGNRLSKQDPGGSCSATPKTGCTTFSYDAANQLTGITYSDGVTPNVSNVTYDNDGQRTGMTDGTGTSSWVWDSLHRLTSYTNGHGDQVQYAYNLRNLVTSITYPGGTQSVTRGYDDAGRWTSVSDWNSNSTGFGYDANSNLTTETLPTATSVVDTYTFDNADNLIGISDTKILINLFSATYTRDNANQLASDTSAPANQTAFKYNALNHLCYAGSGTANACSSPPANSLAFAYDAADNPTELGPRYQAFNAADQVCWSSTTVGSSCTSPPAGATTYTYDVRGNRTGSGSTTLTYDQANRLTAYGSATTYAYNGDGLRMSKTVSGNTTYQVWDVSSGLPLIIKDGSTAYVTGPGGLPIEQLNGSTVLYLHHDQIGSTRLVTDSLGISQATYAYDPWGNLVSSTGTISNPLRFAGQYFDSESGLYYLRARYYDPTAAQFLSRDPITSFTRQPYAFVADDPLNLSDPTGLGKADQLSDAELGALDKKKAGLPLSDAEKRLVKRAERKIVQQEKMDLGTRNVQKRQSIYNREPKPQPGADPNTDPTKSVAAADAESNSIVVGVGVCLIALISAVAILNTPDTLGASDAAGVAADSWVAAWAFAG